MARTARRGDTVTVHYTAYLDSGEEYETSKGREPFEFILGVGQAVPGFEEAVYGLKQGDSVRVTVPPEKGYGQPKEELIVTLAPSQLPANLNPRVGMALSVPQEGGGAMPAVVTDVTESSVTIDANPPLAGKTVDFEIELLEIGENVLPE